MAFSIAMRARFRVLDRGDCAASKEPEDRILIVTRVAHGVGFLAIADAGMPGRELGVLAETHRVAVGAFWDRDMTGTQYFRLLSTAPPAIRLSAPFLPARGTIDLSLSEGKPKIGGRVSVKPALRKSETGNSVTHIDLEGRYIPWEGEVRFEIGGE